jgi:hypothetical protein
MESKLTLKLSKKTIDKGKRLARKRGTSISRMVESYLERLTQVEEEEISPLVKSLSGVVPEKSVKGNYADYLEKKYR